MNSLNLSRAEGIGVGHIDHPGTTIQVSGAALIWMIHGLAGNDKNIVEDVFNSPEYYLGTISNFYFILNAIALFILGIVSFKKTGDICKAMLMQMMPFFSVSLLVWVINVSPEPLLVFSIIMLVTELTWYYGNDINRNGDLMPALLFGLICGFAMATKISFFPLLIIPLILVRKIRYKVLFSFITGLVFVIFVFPAISGNSPYKFFNWIRKIITHSGKYGTGDDKFMEVYSMPANISRIINFETVFVIVFILMLMTAVLFFIPKFRLKINSSPATKTFAAILSAMIIQMIIVLKHFELHYLIPAYLLVVPGLYFSNEIWKKLSGGRIIQKNILLYSLTALLFIIQLKLNIDAGIRYSDYRRSSAEELNVIENSNSKYRICTYGSPGKEFALFIGAASGGKAKSGYYSLIKKMYPANFYYDKWSNIVEIGSNEELTGKISSGGKVTFMCNDETILSNYLALSKKLTGKDPASNSIIFSGSNGVKIYEISF